MSDRPSKKIPIAYLAGIDDDYIAACDNGDLDDEDYFGLLGANLDYLAYEPFRRRLREWQSILDDSLSNKEKHDSAKKNLLKVGTVLAQERRGRPSEYDDLVFQVPAELHKAIELLTPFLEEARTKKLTARERKALFVEHFPYWKQHEGLAFRYRGVMELAIAIICQRYNMSRRGLYNLCTEARKIITPLAPPIKRPD